MKKVNEEESGRRKYEKPALRAIELTAEEVLVAGCKTISSGVAPGGGPPCMIRNCSGRGS